MVFVRRLLHAAAKLRDHLAGKNRAEKLPAKFLRRLQFGSVHAAHGAAHLPDTAQEIGDFNFGEGQRELRGGLSGRSVSKRTRNLLPAGSICRSKSSYFIATAYFPAGLFFHVRLILKFA